MYEDNDLCGSDLEADSSEETSNSPSQNSRIPENQSGSELESPTAQTDSDDDDIAPGCELSDGNDTDSKPPLKKVEGAVPDNQDTPESTVTINPNSDILTSLIGLTRNIGKWFFIVAGVFIGIMLLFQIVPYITAISSIGNPALRWVCIGITIVLFTALLAIIIFLYKKVFHCYLSSSLNGPIEIPVLKQLAERQEWQGWCSESDKNSKFEEIRKKLSAYIKDYDIENKKSLMPDELYKKLEKHYNTLKRDLEFIDNEWINNFTTEFQKTLDEAAANIVMKYAIRTGVSTALSPKALADRFLVIIMSLAMIKDLLLLYKVKPRFGETLIVFGFTLVNVYVGGKTQWLVGQGVEGLKDNGLLTSLKATWHIIRPDKGDDSNLGESDTDVLSDSAGDLLVLNGVSVLSFLQKPVKMATEGLINFSLIRWLGKTLMPYLQPTKPPKKN